MFDIIKEILISEKGLLILIMKDLKKSIELHRKQFDRFCSLYVYGS